MGFVQSYDINMRPIPPMVTKNKREVAPPEPEPAEGPDPAPAEPVREESYRERLARLEAEEEVAAKAEYEKKMAARARPTPKVPFEAARGASEVYKPAFHGLADRLRDPRQAFEPGAQDELRKAIDSRSDWYRSTTDGR